jgi:hypothetical protein
MAEGLERKNAAQLTAVPCSRPRGKAARRQGGKSEPVVDKGTFRRIFEGERQTSESRVDLMEPDV